jgi:hypothetical protein
MTLGVGYAPDTISPFFISLKRSGFTGDVAYFTYALPPATQLFLRQYGVTILPFTPNLYNGRRYYLYTRMTRPADWLAATPGEVWRTSQLWMHLMNARFTAFRQYWENVHGLYDEILIVDLPDVLFQAHPFSFRFDCDVAFFAEDGRRKIRDCRRNTQWLHRAYGARAVEECGDKPILCAGVVYLRASRAQDYLTLMVETMRKRELKTAMDQGVHNYIGYKGLIDGSRIYTQDETPVMNIGTMALDTIPRDTEGYVTDYSGRRAAIVHQYDRFPTLSRELSDLLCR